MEETIRLKCEKTGRIKISEHLGKLKTLPFSTPDFDGMELNNLFNDIRDGDILELTFTNVRICRCCGQKLKKVK